jgi:mono/diheme cytochrome c family protein
LRRVLMNGIEGTSMPSFHLMQPEEIESLVSYVIFLSLRGQTEFLTLVELSKMKKELDAKKADLRAAETKGDANRVKGLDEEIKPQEEELTGPQADRVRGFAALVAQQWVDSQKAAVVPTPELAKKFEEMNDKDRVESAARGYRIFTVKELGGCAECHVNLGRDSTYRYDAWATIVKPRNLLANNLRGGRRPIDLYWRIHTGINGAGMPALIAAEADRTKTLKDDIKPTDDDVLKKIKSSTKEEWVWDLVNFIQIAPYPEKRQELKKLGVVVDSETEIPAKSEH